MTLTPSPLRLLAQFRKHASLACLGGLALLTAGCQQKPVPGAPLYAVDFAGAAKACKTSPVDLSTGKSANATMTLANDGGWCGILVSQSVAPQRKDDSGLSFLSPPPANAKKPFAAGLMQTRAEHGRVYVHSVGDETRIDYTPDPGFTGNDRFAVRLLPGDPILTVAVTVAAK